MTICHAIFHVHTLFFCYITNACIHDITRPIVQQTNCIPIGWKLLGFFLSFFFKSFPFFYFLADLLFKYVVSNTGFEILAGDQLAVWHFNRKSHPMTSTDTKSEWNLSYISNFKLLQMLSNSLLNIKLNIWVEYFKANLVGNDNNIKMCHDLSF